MRIALVTGIFPPDIGGPATHAADLREELARREHRVTVVTLWDGPATDHVPGLVRFPRRWPWPLRLAAVTRWLLQHRDRYDVVYATGLHVAAVAGARLAGRPVVVKVVGDEAWERGRRQGLTDQDFEAFQRTAGGPVPLRAMRWVRNWSLRRATFVTAPSQDLAHVIEGWLEGPAAVSVIPNGVRVPPKGGARRSARRGLRAAFIGRLVDHKRVDVLLEAVAGTEGVAFDVVGDGPERERLEARARRLELQKRVKFTGVLSHEEVLERLLRADALLLVSDHEGLPHVAIEALACGVPLIASLAGGTAEVLRDRENGLALQEASVDAVSEALERLRDDPVLRRRLARGARRSCEEWRVERCADRVEALLRGAASRKPRVVFLGKSSIPWALDDDLGRKLDILAWRLDTTIVGLGRPGVGWLGRVRTVLFPTLRPSAVGGVIFYSLAPLAAVALVVGRRRSAIVCQSPYEAVGVRLVSGLLPKTLRPRVVVEVHGDWRAASRLYGSPLRRLIRRPGDRVAVWALRGADRVRAIGAYTEALVRAAGYERDTDRFPTYSDYGAFLREPVVPPPEEPRALFVGALQETKGVDLLLQAWPLVEERVPGARLSIVGDGPGLERLRRHSRRLGVNGSVAFMGAVPRSRVRDLLDESRLLVLPSRSEGLGRVAIEALARARPVVASEVGGIPEVIEDGVTGRLVPPGDPRALAEAVAGLLRDREAGAAMGERGRHLVLDRDPAGAFEAGIARLADWIAGR